MYTQTISKIKSKMAGELLPAQLDRLEKVLHEVFMEQERLRKPARDKNNLVKQFISAKK